MRIDEPFLDGMKENGPVAIDLSKGLPPGIDMGVEMNEPERAMPRPKRPQKGQGDAVIAAKGHEMVVAPRLLFDQLVALRQIAERDLEISDVGDGQGRRSAQWGPRPPPTSMALARRIASGPNRVPAR